MARWTARLDWRAKLVWAPAQTPGLHAATGITEAQTDASAWAILPSGQRASGARAIGAALDQLLPGGPPLYRGLMSLPGLRTVADVGYRWLAKNRHRIPSGPATCSIRSPDPLAEAVAEELERRLGGRVG